jgi:thymidylate synthase (FAD)
MTIDPYFKVKLIAATPNPNQVVWHAMHQDYSEGFVGDEDPPSEAVAGEIAIKRLLAGNRGHFGVFEHPQITLNAGWFPHSVMQQARTHRIGVSFDVQSGRYTSERILRVNKGELPVEEVFYLRPIGEYRDRQGKKYEYTFDERLVDITRCQDAANHYAYRLRCGHSEEHARDLIPYAIRQHFVVSFSLRSLMHFLDLRAKADAQLEIQQLCQLIMPEFEGWTPELADWYKNTRLGKARLAP